MYNYFVLSNLKYLLHVDSTFQLMTIKDEFVQPWNCYLEIEIFQIIGTVIKNNLTSQIYWQFGESLV